ncbi:OLC1v1011276C2 [Oldenlandia corymbosa var. corymbosa]|uniref:OLC1v1011276C2 n=1 Tax=Oldenlandia corymbosa var. corymbosa TaxID=529605 RepID=A0AAV1DWH0_OLDCO|nr:OLC1v1011276C2 [Oldenlandia corymbosa var. corymbosa]
MLVNLFSICFGLAQAKKKVALLLQKLKKYELPELPSPKHDPELLTPEQLQAYKKIGYKNRNYVPVGVRGVFGGVVQNMHLHWKFHETVQVCCDNFPKEKIREMASMLARLSGGIVVNIHDVKTIIMFRGRNYRQPKNLIPINTLTKRKALFKARFEQALESQKLNIKKKEQELRRMGISPDDPVAMASIRKTASIFFNAIDQREGSPYAPRKDKEAELESSTGLEQTNPAEDSDQEDLDKFIAEIEDAADKEWAAEEAAEKEEFGRLRYWNREQLGDRFRRSEQIGDEDEESDDNISRRSRKWNNAKHRRHRMNASEDEDGDGTEDNEVWDSNDNGASEHETDVDEFKFSTVRGRPLVHNASRLKRDNPVKTSRSVSFKSNKPSRLNLKGTNEDSFSEDMLSDLEDVMYESDDVEEENDVEPARLRDYDYRNNCSEDSYHHDRNEEEKPEVVKGSRKVGGNGGKLNNPRDLDETWDSD